METQAAAIDSVPTPVQVPVHDTHHGLKQWGKGWVTPEKWEENNRLRLEALARGRANRFAKGKDDDASIRGLVMLVWRHLDDKECPKGFSKEAKVLWKAAQENKMDFLGKYLPMFVKQERPEEKGEDEAVKGNLQLIEEWFAQQEGVCPHCGRGPDRLDEPEVQNAKDADDEREQAASNATAPDSSPTPKKRTCSRPRRKLTVKLTPSVNDQKELATSTVGGKDWEEL